MPQRCHAKFSMAPLMRSLAIETAAELAECAGVDRRRAHEWISNGVGWAKADELAIKLTDRHPCLIWGNEWWLAVERRHRRQRRAARGGVRP